MVSTTVGSGADVVDLVAARAAMASSRVFLDAAREQYHLAFRRLAEAKRTFSEAQLAHERAVTTYCRAQALTEEP